MRAALTMTLNDLRLRFKDRSLFLFGLIVPFALMLIFSLLLGPLTSGAPFKARVLLVDMDGSVLSGSLRVALTAAAEAGVISWEQADDAAGARGALRAGEAEAAIIVPAGFGAAVLRASGANEGGAAVTLTVLGDANGALAAQITESVATAYLSRLRSGVWATAALATAGRPVLPALVLAQVAQAPEPLTLEEARSSGRQLSLATYYSVAMAVFFVFFTVQIGVMGILDEEREGTLARLLAAPVSRNSILGAKVLSSMTIGTLSMIALAVASGLLMGADWGPALGALALVLAVVASAAGIMLLVAGLVRSTEGAGNVQTVVALTLGLLGGAFFPLPEATGLMGWLPKVSPHHWFIRGIGDLTGGGVAAIYPSVAALVLFALVTGAAGWALLRRRLAA